MTLINDNSFILAWTLSHCQEDRTEGENGEEGDITRKRRKGNREQENKRMEGKEGMEDREMEDRQKE
jgi:hypothetical protein